VEEFQLTPATKTQHLKWQLHAASNFPAQQAARREEILLKKLGVLASS
jgi:hypothetical protein